MTLNKISKAFFINLDRREDRLEHINKSLPFLAERFSAVDARSLELSKEVKKLFPKTWNSRSKAEICCAISHYRVWKKLVEDKSSDNFLILEDDVVFNSRFVDFWNKVFSENMPSNYSLIYLGGCQPWNKPHYHKVLAKYNDYFCNIKKNDYFSKDDHFWHMNASSYILSKNAASVLCQWVDQNGIDDAVDNFIQKFFNKNVLFTAPKSIYHLNPLMARQLHEENNNTEIDKNSDIRFAEEKFKSNNKISIIIPTIWRANDYIMRSLLDLDKVDCVGEVIVINNDKAKTPHWINSFKKVKLIDPKKRMYFNESVNFGIDLCENNICCIYNDDIISDTRVFDYVRNNLTQKDGCIFISPEYINKKSSSNGNLRGVSGFLANGLQGGSGMMMFLMKQSFIKIPRELVHHFGDVFIFEINKRQGKQNYIIEGFPIKTPGSASEDNDVRKIISQDWSIHKQIFNNLDEFIEKEEMCFPLLKEVSNKQIPKKIHLSWKNKNILDSEYELIKKGAKNLELLNPDWDIEVYDDEDINRLLRDSIGRDNWNLIKDRKITEKTDLWRLLKTYKEGGLYIDIDRYIDTPISEVVNRETSYVLPTFQDVDFSQDFILTCPKNPIVGRAIANNLKYRKQEKPLFFLAVYSYMQSVCEILGTKIIDRGNNPEYFNDIRNKINKCEYLETYRESGPANHILFRNKNSDFSTQQFERDKADFYNGCNVTHWNNDTRNKHESIDLRSGQKLDIKKEKRISANLEVKQQQFIQLKDQWQNFKDYDFLKYVSNQLPKEQSPEGKFNTYNPNQKIAIVSLYTKEISDYAVHSENSIKEYCQKQGYTFYIYREKLEENSSPNWSKAQALVNHIDDHEYIIWMDSDTLIFNPEKKLESIIEKASRKFILATKDIGDNCMLNSGVLFFKSHQYTKNLITKWRDFDGDKSSLYASGGDQEILCEILKKSDGFGFNRKIFEMNEFNTDPRLVNNDTFILHFMAYPYALKKIFMSYWNHLES
jgi:GR25 family glycosyltransferase involved in LPS biosynthesis